MTVLRTWMLVLFLTLLLSPSVFADESLKTVTAEGVGTSADRGKARDDAILDAQRRAVEQGVGLFLKSESLVSNFELLEDTIYSQAQGYVHTYRVTSEVPSDQGCRVTIEAQVRLGKIEQDLDDISARLRVAGSPRVIVAISQPQGGDAATLAESRIRERLVNEGFKVLDETQLEQTRWRQAEKLLRANRPRLADVLWLQDAADLVIVGTATYRDLGEQRMGEESYYSCEGRMEVKAVRTDTAEVVAAGRGEVGARAAFTRTQAIEAAISGAAEDWLKRNLGLLVKAALDPTRDCTVSLMDCNHSDVQALTRGLSDLRFVRAVRLRAFDRGLAQLEVQYVGTAQKLSAELGAIRGLRLRVDGVTANTIRARVR